MKTLLTTILILLSVTVIGQNKYCVGVSYPATVIGQDDSTFIIKQDGWHLMSTDLDTPFFIGASYPVPQVFTEYVMVTNKNLKSFLLQVLTEYETDCYNDTIKHSGNIVFGMPSHPYSYYQIGGEWYRRTRPTFKGFINWLKKKQ